MQLGLKLFVSSFLLLFLLMSQGCSGGGGSSSATEQDTSIIDPITPIDPVNPSVVLQASTFGINLSNIVDKETQSVSISEYSISIKRDDKELLDVYKEYITIQKDQSGNIIISMKYDETDKNGISGLQLGDVITFDAEGYTPQQFIVTQTMLDSGAVALAIKPIESRQTFSLADLVNNGDSVQPRSAFGATTRVSGDSVILETIDKKTQLTIPKVSYERMVRKISRLPRSTTTTQVFVDMTSVDPVTEHSATIGDFSYDPDSEPASERTTSAATSQDNGLESVIMSDIQMSTDAGDEIHCFGDGDYDPLTSKCSDGAQATLKMQIPQSQFEEYALKYNNGDKIVPLYSYNKEKAIWVRQLDANGAAIDGELVLVDNDNNKLANGGDTLYLEGKVGHFSWWNGDYPYENTCLNVKLDLANSASDISYIYAEGVDYSGRTITRNIRATDTQINNISTKANAMVSVSLIMKSGEVGDKIVYTTGSPSETCEDIGTLVSPSLTKHEITVKVNDVDGKPIKNASISNGGSYLTSDDNGTVVFNQSYKDEYNVTISASYNIDGFDLYDTTTVKNTTTETIVFVFDIQKITYTGTIVENVKGTEKAASNAYVHIYGDGYYQYAYVDGDGKFTINLPSSKVKANATASIYISSYNSEYAYSPSIRKKITLSANDTDLGKFILSFNVHTITGRVTNTLGEPVLSSYVLSNSRYSYVDSNGYYKMYLITAEGGQKDSLYAYDYASATQSDKQEVSLDSNTTNEINFVLDLRKATIKGAILSSTGVALEGMRVYWTQDYSSVLTDEKGEFLLETYREGDGSLVVYNPNSYDYLKFDAASNQYYIEVLGAKKGEIVDVGNLLASSGNLSPIVKSISVSPDQPVYGKDFSLIVDAYDPDGDPLTYTFEQVYATSAKIDSNASQAIVNVEAAGYYYFNIEVSDGKEVVSKRTSTYVKNHVKPVINSVYTSYTNGNYDKSADATVSVNAYSEEGNTLSYAFTLTNMNSYVVTPLTSNENNATIPTTISDGKYKLTITVSDLYNSASTYKYLTVDQTVAPTIESIFVNNVDLNNSSLNIKAPSAEQKFSVLLSKGELATPLTWRWSLGASSSTEETFAKSFSTSGYYVGYVTVTDKIGRSSSKSFYVNVQENQKPVINSVTITPDIITKIVDGYKDGAGNAVESISISVNASDTDSADLTYSFGNIDSKDGYSKTDTTEDNTATYSLSDLSVGVHAIKVSVSDGTNSVEKFINFTIKENTPPQITTFIVPLNARMGTTVNVISSAQDANSDSLTYKWSADNGAVVSNPNSKETTLTLPNTAITVEVTLEVSDGVNKATRKSSIIVLDNQKPTISYFGVSPLSIIQNAEIELKSQYGDSDGKIISATYILNAPDGSTTTYDAKTVSKIKLDTVGIYSVSLEVIDDNNAKTISDTIKVTVVKANQAPIITTLTSDKMSLLRGETATLSVVASDPDNDNFTIAWSATSGGVIVKDTISVDKATFSSSALGEYTVTVIAEDVNALKSVKTLKINVIDTAISLSASKTGVLTGEEVTLTAIMSSGHAVPSDTQWSFTLKPAGSAVAITPNGATATFTPDIAGTYTVKGLATLNGVNYESTISISASDKATTPSVDGYVKSGEDVLEGAMVRLYNKDDVTLFDQTSSTDVNGYFKFIDVPAGTYYLVTYAGNGYIANTEVIIITGE